MTKTQLEELEAMQALGLSAESMAQELGVSLETLVKESPIEESNQESLKAELHATALSIVRQIKSGLRDLDSQDLARSGDTLAKLHTAFCREDPGTVINIQNNQLAQFRQVLKP